MQGQTNVLLNFLCKLATTLEIDVFILTFILQILVGIFIIGALSKTFNKTVRHLRVRTAASGHWSRTLLTLPK